MSDHFDHEAEAWDRFDPDVLLPAIPYHPNQLKGNRKGCSDSVNEWETLRPWSELTHPCIIPGCKGTNLRPKQLCLDCYEADVFARRNWTVIAHGVIDCGEVQDGLDVYHEWEVRPDIMEAIWRKEDSDWSADIKKRLPRVLVSKILSMPVDKFPMSYGKYVVRKHLRTFSESNTTT